ncbi:hypothetical protein ACFLUJ_04600 [Chloroflexota bacterium]
MKVERLQSYSMGLLSRKPRIKLEEFCQYFYDTHIFHLVIDGKDTGSIHSDELFDHFVEADPAFSSVDRDVFKNEIIAVCMEMFGLAWENQKKRDIYLLREIVFARDYLKNNDQLDIWVIMGDYSKTIAASIFDIANGQRTSEAYISNMNQFKTKLFEKWVETGIDQDCAKRVYSRIGADVSWKRRSTVYHVCGRLAERLGCPEDINSEVLSRLSVTIYQFYTGAKEAIESVNIQL